MMILNIRHHTKFLPPLRAEDKQILIYVSDFLKNWDFSANEGNNFSHLGLKQDLK